MTASGVSSSPTPRRRRWWRWHRVLGLALGAVLGLLAAGCLVR